jgi:N-acetylglucosamine malate deacetylase 1
MVKMKVLAIGAHPDDIEILCAGTLARYAREGHEVFMCHLCSGDKGSAKHTSEEIAKIRRKEAIESAKIIGAVSIWGGLSDGEVVVDLDARKKVVDIIRQADPDLVITHSPTDYHADHINTSKLVFEAIYLANIKLWESDHEPSTKLPYLYYMDTLAGVNFQPQEYVDITDTIDTKIEMMLCMPSQLGWLKDMHNSNAPEFIEAVARFRGFQAAVQYAEAFYQQKMYPQGLTKRVLP